MTTQNVAVARSWNATASLWLPIEVYRGICLQ